MNKKEKRYLYILGFLTLIAILYKLVQPKPVDWSESYSSTDKKPFGAYILRDQLSVLFPYHEISENQLPIFEAPLNYDEKNWIFINSEFSIDQFETQFLMDEVEFGSHVFISAWNMENSFSDSLGFKLTQQFPYINPSANSLDSLLKKPLNFVNPELKTQNGWDFPIALNEVYFSEFDTSKTVVLGSDNRNNINFIKIEHGDGAFFLHTSPFLFTNYFLKNQDKYDYAFKALSYLPETDTYWDEYYKVGKLAYSSPFRFIVSKPNLKRAWFLALIGLVLYLFFKSKRMQRAIPEIKPLSNTSIEFAKTIGNLHLNKGTHKDLFKKKYAFFLDYIRTNLNIDTNDLNSEMISKVSQRAGLPEEETQELFNRIELFSTKEAVTDNELKSITEQIDNFYKKSQR
jgi:hypothetical protein